MATYRQNNIIFETHYNEYINKWMVNAYDRTRCYFKNRRLREGTYPIFNEVMVSVSYNGAPSHAPLDEFDVTISFFKSCTVARELSQPCS